MAIFHSGQCGGSVPGGPRAVCAGPSDSGPAPPTLLVYVDPRAAQLLYSASDADLFGVDPRSASVLTSASDADFAGIDPRAAQLIFTGSDSDPFGVDPRSASVLN